MAELRLYSPDEIAERNKPKRQQKREARERQINEYQEQLASAGPGFGGEILLDDGEDKRKVRAMLKEAADRAGLQLRFRPIKDRSRIEFAIDGVIRKTSARSR